MIKKGLLVKLNKNDAIVMSDHGRFERIVLRDDMQIGMRIHFTDDDLIKSTQDRREFIMNAKKNFVAAVVVMAVVVMGSFGYIYINNTNERVIPEVAETMNLSAIVTVDINPSFKLFVDHKDQVIEVKAMNGDAKKVETDDLSGLTVDDVIELIVIRSNEAGFIDLTDLEDDFVVISVANIAENDQAKKIFEVIKEKVKESKTLREVTLAMAEVDEETLYEAEKKSIIAGIMNVTESQKMTVKEFFENEDNLMKFLVSGEVIPQDVENKIMLMSTYMQQLKNSFANKETLNEAFNYSKENFFQAKEKYQLAIEAYNNAVESEDQAKKDQAMTQLQLAETFKNQMEQAKDDVESVKEVLEAVIEGEDTFEMNETEKQSIEKIIEQERLEEQKRLEEQERLEEQKRLEEQERLEEQKRLEEQERLEEQKRLEEQERLEEQKRLEEQEHLEEQKRLEEQERLEEQKRLEEQERLEEQKRLEEQERLEEQKRLEEQERLEEQKRLEEQDRLEEQERLKEQERLDEQQGKENFNG